MFMIMRQLTLLILTAFLVVGLASAQENAVVIAPQPCEVPGTLTM
jgi:uncharacterized protein YcfL